MAIAFADIAFTPSVLRTQEQNGSGRYAGFLSETRSGGDRLGEDERAFIGNYRNLVLVKFEPRIALCLNCMLIYLICLIANC